MPELLASCDGNELQAWYDFFELHGGMPRQVEDKRWAELLAHTQHYEPRLPPGEFSHLPQAEPPGLTEAQQADRWEGLTVVTGKMYPPAPTLLPFPPTT